MGGCGVRGRGRFEHEIQPGFTFVMYFIISSLPSLSLQREALHFSHEWFSYHWKSYPPAYE